MLNYFLQNGGNVTQHRECNIASLHRDAGPLAYIETSIWSLTVFVGVSLINGLVLACHIPDIFLRRKWLQISLKLDENQSSYAHLIKTCFVNSDTLNLPHFGIRYFGKVVNNWY